MGAFNRYRYAANNPYLFTDPDGRMVKIAGSEEDVAAFMDEASAITGLELTNTDGVISYQGDASNGAAATFISAIDASETIQVNAVNANPSVLLDQFSSNAVDVADLAGFNAASPELGQAVFTHIFSERLYAAKTGADETTSHRVAIRAESAVMGAERRTIGGLISTPQGFGIAPGHVIKWEYRDSSGAIIKQFNLIPDINGTPR